MMAVGLDVKIEFQLAVVADAPTIVELKAAVAEDMTRRHGRGLWSSYGTTKGVLFAMRSSRVYLAMRNNDLLGMFRLTTKKPWAIDVSYFTPCERALYLVDMAVLPMVQGRGIGRRCLKEAKRLANAWPADAIRLDAFDHAAGAGGFYASCGYTEVGRATFRQSSLIYYELLLKPKAKRSVPAR